MLAVRIEGPKEGDPCGMNEEEICLICLLFAKFVRLIPALIAQMRL